MNEQRVIKAVIYDVDGMMVDSEPLHVFAWSRTLQAYGHQLAELSPALKITMADKKPIAIAASMIEELHLATTAEEFLAKKTALFMDLAADGIQEIPGAVASIQRLSQTYLLGIGTVLDRDYINLVLNKLGVTNYFKVVVTGEEITNSKPDPETYLTVANKLGVKPEECVALEDTPSGVASAKAAGCYCIAIASPNAIPQNVSQADQVVPSLDAVTGGSPSPQNNTPPPPQEYDPTTLVVNGGNTPGTNKASPTSAMQ